MCVYNLLARYRTKLAFVMVTQTQQLSQDEDGSKAS